MADKSEAGNMSDFLTCSICLEIFKTPKYLPCLHTFCDTCLLAYITSWFEKGKGSKIECPVCRVEVLAPSEGCTAEGWTKTLPSNFLLAGLIENRKVTRSEKLCMLCERFGSKSVSKATFVCLQCADALCDTCEKYHSFNKASVDHVIKPIGKICEEQLFPVFRNNCEIHRDETLKLYCVDHKVPCCSICVSISHRKCEDVTTLEDAARGIKESSVVGKVREGLEKANDVVDGFIKRYQDSTDETVAQYNEHFKTVETNFAKIKEVIEKQETLRKSQLEKMYAELKNRRETVFTFMENKRKAIQQDKQILDACLKKASEMQVMIEISKFEKALERYQEEEKASEKAVSSFNDKISLKNFDISDFVVQMQNAMEVILDSLSVKLTFNRFSSLSSRVWNVSSNTDAICFSVSTPVNLIGFLSYGCGRLTQKCSIQVTLQKDGQILRKLSTSLSTKSEDYNNNVTELYLEQPLQILSGVLYEVLFVMKSIRDCYHGDSGMSKVDCDGIVFTFSNSSKSDNGTDTTRGQIPGFIFRK